ncbi:MAG: hypothetical protein CMH64_03585 [Nanoarchaeota archaeon]|nr:hypothetical protein [Nanoarchaeota archaeon]|tara:strand:- start:3591 stop:3920 length:330 start_codon:yes stop_codon:yes gene_type:complete
MDALQEVPGSTAIFNGWTGGVIRREGKHFVTASIGLILEESEDGMRREFGRQDLEVEISSEEALRYETVDGDNKFESIDRKTYRAMVESYPGENSEFFLAWYSGNPDLN